MSDDALARRIEQRSLRFGIGANAVMTLAGFVAHVLTGSSALLLDGLYSAVLVGSSLIASRISRNVVRPPDRAWPYGYEGQEALYVLFRSLVLLGVIGFGLSSSCGTLIDWWRGAEIPSLTLEPVAAYTVAVTGLCWLLSWRHFRDWRRTGRISLLLLTEARNARIDALITASTGLALLATPLLQTKLLAPLAPITDALLVLAVSGVLLREPLQALRDALSQAAGKAADPGVLQRTRQVLMQELSGLSLQMMDFTVQQLGRTAFVVVYINPLEPLDSATVDGLRHHIDARCSNELGRPVRAEVILTVMPPIHRSDPEQQPAP
ncbi:cation efflux transporter [Synechococcus sp. A15-127]|uniref:cation transporter n=1 Tax=Synechococcus sp. A15-127 TaxID=1050624 RepID=UPI0016475DA6|nr:cation transporter [Synechococcus sp. A15-127]QNI94862.1 cation efflux transporter [Synechococcus sp. A15-127]